MTSALTECSPDQLSFVRVKGKKVIANFKGGTLTSDGGLVLIAELDKKRQITARFASCFTDHRPARVCKPFANRFSSAKNLWINSGVRRLE